MKVIILAFFSLLALLNTKAQVSIGDQLSPNGYAILDLTNSNSLGLLLPHSAGNPNLNPALSAAPEGLLMYYKENFFLKGSGTTFNAITPWESIYTGATPGNVYFNPAVFEGVGIGVDGWLPGNPPTSNIKANLHIGLKSKDVNTANTSASLLIGDSDSGVHMSMDNDEILVKNSTANNTGTLKLQEGGGTVQVGDPAIAPYTVSANRSTLNVTGEIQQHGFALVPKGGIIMWTGSTAPSGWALCKGQLITNLDGTTSTAPDLRERFIVGAMGENTTNAVSGTAYPIGVGADEGRNKVTLTESQCALPNHNHSINHGHSISDPGHDHDIDLDDSLGGGGIDDSGNGDSAGSDETSSETTGITVDNHVGNSGNKNIATASSDHENRPPYYALAFIIKL